MITATNICELAEIGTAYADYPDVKNSKRRILAYDIEFEYHNGVKVLVEKGLNWDEATIPAPLTWLFPKSGMFAYAALPHDVAYYGKFCTRKEADWEYLLYSRQLYKNNWKAWFRWIMVRLTGWYWWNRTTAYGEYNKTKIKVIA